MNPPYISSVVGEGSVKRRSVYSLVYSPTASANRAGFDDGGQYTRELVQIDQ